MLTPVPNLTRDNSDNRRDTTGTLEGEAAVYQRGFQKLLKARPTALQLAAMRAAAYSAARLDRALANDGISGATLSHYERTARKTRTAMLEAFAKPQPQPHSSLRHVWAP
jgi:hypothetical protein